MTVLTPALDAALRGDAPIVFGAVALALPGGTVNLLDGAGTLTFGGATWVGDDAAFGSLAAVDTISDGAGDNAPALALTLFPADGTAATTLCAPEMQGAGVTLWLGAVDRATGAVIADPQLLFLGELDVPTLTADTGKRAIEYTVVSAFERLFEDDASARLSSGHHRSLFPAEAGLDFVTGVDQPVFWGVEGTPSAITYGRRWQLRRRFRPALQRAAAVSATVVDDPSRERDGGQMVRRRDAAQATLDQWRDRPLRLGTSDCVRMAASHLRRLGQRVKLPPAGAYRSLPGAVKALRQRGYDTLAAALDGEGLERIAPATAVVGDLVMLPSADGLGALTVALGNGRVVGYHDDVAGGAAVLQPLTFDAAWRVLPLAGAAQS